MDQGLLVPDELVVDLVVDRVNQEDCKNGYVLGRLPADHPPGRGAAQRRLPRMGTEAGTTPST